MTVTEIAPIELTLLNGPDRPQGVHVSDIISDLMRRLEPERYARTDGEGKPIPIDSAKVHAGVAFERGLEKILAKLVFPGLFRPEPFQHEGIWMSPDGIIPDPWGPAEYKLTWYSAKKECPMDPVFRPWIWQMQAYCKGLGATRALLVPQFINGDYNPPKPLPPRRIWIEWSQVEIDMTWEMLRGHAISLKWL